MLGRHRLSPSEKKTQDRINKKNEKARVDAFLQKKGHGVTKPKPKPKPLTPAQVSAKKGEAFRQSITPSNPATSAMQRLQKALSPEKKNKKR